ncbi:phosphatidylinositol transfer protein 3-like [Impatiens glandulifera]|uniref:phosphatidylinositol transfer protein 3-like n=1 Tax=Impatiens glandulifera TaxID=253017 RepID=UPI001FB12CEF|nr:phosphatidylinositol transfer protein 3-like [Impatiens glandulifera]XP_047326987.1 phosphatidylinositol transfer protein 3-like [Impatiens glandulifera]XP_047326988.1 phosphatidylinositol transfer protein 3-like [Impatiens glandulifera]
MFRRGKNRDPENEEQIHEAKVNELRDAIGPLYGRSLKYCSDACLRRYLEARNWNVGKSKKMLEETIKWRSTYKPEEIIWEEVATESETGKLFRANFHDQNRRSVLIMKPGLQNTKSLDNQIRHLVYLLENAILNLPKDEGQMVWLIDFTGMTMNTSIPIKSARETVNILQNHYPERLAVAFLYNPPHIFEAFWKIVKYFLDAKTIHKVKFVYPMNNESVEVMKSYFDIDNLPSEFGGKATLKYNHDEFSKMMSQDDERSAASWGFTAKNSNSCLSNVEVTSEPAVI